MLDFERFFEPQETISVMARDFLVTLFQQAGYQDSDYVLSEIPQPRALTILFTASPSQSADPTTTGNDRSNKSTFAGETKQKAQGVGLDSRSEKLRDPKTSNACLLESDNFAASLSPTDSESAFETSQRFYYAKLEELELIWEMEAMSSDFHERQLLMESTFCEFEREQTAPSFRAAFFYQMATMCDHVVKRTHRSAAIYPWDTRKTVRQYLGFIYLAVHYWKQCLQQKVDQIQTACVVEKVDAAVSSTEDGSAWELLNKEREMYRLVIDRLETRLCHLLLIHDLSEISVVVRDRVVASQFGPVSVYADPKPLNTPASGHNPGTIYLPKPQARVVWSVRVTLKEMQARCAQRGLTRIQLPFDGESFDLGSVTPTANGLEILPRLPRRQWLPWLLEEGNGESGLFQQVPQVPSSSKSATDGAGSLNAWTRLEPLSAGQSNGTHDHVPADSRPGYDHSLALGHAFEEIYSDFSDHAEGARRSRRSKGRKRRKQPSRRWRAQGQHCSDERDRRRHRQIPSMFNIHADGHNHSQSRKYRGFGDSDLDIPLFEAVVQKLLSLCRFRETFALVNEVISFQDELEEFLLETGVEGGNQKKRQGYKLGTLVRSSIRDALDMVRFIFLVCDPTLDRLSLKQINSALFIGREVLLETPYKTFISATGMDGVVQQVETSKASNNQFRSEMFTVCDAGCGKIAFKTEHNTFLSADSDGRTIRQVKAADSGEANLLVGGEMIPNCQFSLQDLGQGKSCLESCWRTFLFVGADRSTVEQSAQALSYEPHWVAGKLTVRLLDEKTHSLMSQIGLSGEASGDIEEEEKHVCGVHEAAHVGDADAEREIETALENSWAGIETIDQFVDIPWLGGGSETKGAKTAGKRVNAGLDIARGGTAGGERFNQMQKKMAWKADRTLVDQQQLLLRRLLESPYSPLISTYFFALERQKEDDEQNRENDHSGNEGHTEASRETFTELHHENIDDVSIWLVGRLRKLDDSERCTFLSWLQERPQMPEPLSGIAYLFSAALRIARIENHGALAAMLQSNMNELQQARVLATHVVEVLATLTARTRVCNLPMIPFSHMYSWSVRKLSSMKTCRNGSHKYGPRTSSFSHPTTQGCGRGQCYELGEGPMKPSLGLGVWGDPFPVDGAEKRATLPAMMNVANDLNMNILLLLDMSAVQLLSHLLWVGHNMQVSGKAHKNTFRLDTVRTLIRSGQLYILRSEQHSMFAGMDSDNWTTEMPIVQSLLPFPVPFTGRWFYGNGSESRGWGRHRAPKGAIGGAEGDEIEPESVAALSEAIFEVQTMAEAFVQAQLYLPGSAPFQWSRLQFLTYVKCCRWEVELGHVLYAKADQLSQASQSSSSFSSSTSTPTDSVTYEVLLLAYFSFFSSSHAPGMRRTLAMINRGLCADHSGGSGPPGSVQVGSAEYERKRKLAERVLMVTGETQMLATALRRFDLWCDDFRTSDHFSLGSYLEYHNADGRDFTTSEDEGSHCGSGSSGDDHSDDMPVNPYQQSLSAIPFAPGSSIHFNATPGRVDSVPCSPQQGGSDGSSGSDYYTDSESSGSYSSSYTGSGSGYTDDEGDDWTSNRDDSEAEDGGEESSASDSDEHKNGPDDSRPRTL